MEQAPKGLYYTAEFPTPPTREQLETLRRNKSWPKTGYWITSDGVPYSWNSVRRTYQAVRFVREVAV